MLNHTADKKKSWGTNAGLSDSSACSLKLSHPGLQNVLERTLTFPLFPIKIVKGTMKSFKPSLIIFPVHINFHESVFHMSP